MVANRRITASLSTNTSLRAEIVLSLLQVHKLNLRPAHLSYKCTVCSATFNLYRQFENHVYTQHSGTKRPNDVSQANAANKKAKTVDLRMNGI